MVGNHGVPSCLGVSRTEHGLSLSSVSATDTEANDKVVNGNEMIDDRRSKQTQSEEKDENKEEKKVVSNIEPEIDFLKMSHLSWYFRTCSSIHMIFENLK